jgi:hypothetical protein
MDLDLRAVRVLLLIVLGLIVGYVACFLFDLTRADAQGVGVFGTSATGTRTNCTQITSPVAGQTWCFDQSTSTLQAWTGTVWTPITIATGVAYGTPTCTNNCGQSAGSAPSIVGTNTASRITLGAGTGSQAPATPFLVLFPSAFATAPSCNAQLVSPTTTAASVSSANASTTGVLVNTVVNPPINAIYALHCIPVVR